MSGLCTSLQPDDENDSSFLTRQLRGVATFLAPPPPSSESPSPSPSLLGVRNDLAEFGGSLKTGLSLLSVAGISKLSSNLLPVRNRASEDDGGSASGITDEILGLSLRFRSFRTVGPAFLYHWITMVKILSCPVLRMILSFCPPPRLLKQEMHLCTSFERTQVSEESTLDSTERDTLVEKTQGEEISSLEKKDLTEIVNTADRLRIEDEESTEQWSEKASVSSGTFVDDPKKLEHEDDISFSDLEGNESDIYSRSSGLRSAQAIRGCSPSGSNDWVRLNRSSAIGGVQQRLVRQKRKIQKVKVK